MLHHMLRASLAPKTVPTFSYRATYNSTSNLTTYTFNNCDIGTAANDRLVVVTIIGLSSNSITTRSVSSATIGGISATPAINTARVTLNSIVAATVTTGTTATIAFTASGSLSNALIGVYAVYGLLSTTARTATNLASGVTGDPNISTTINGLANAVVIASTGIIENRTATWTGVTENYDQLVESDLRSGGSIQLTETNSGYSVDCTFGGGNGTGSLSVVSWR